MDQHEKNLLRVLPDDHSNQVDDWYYIGQLAKIDKQKIKVLDLGAGEGGSKPRMESLIGEKLDWTGVDIGDSDEVKGRARGAIPIDYYNGVDLPYGDGEFDVVWSRQVLEHVRFPDRVISEVSRVLKPGGLFIGSVSQLEPYHSRSIFNWTHYGVMTVLADHGLDVFEMRPGADGVLLLMRSLFGRRTNLNHFFRVEAPINHLIQYMFTHDASRSANVKTANFQKLKATGHIHFASRKK